MASTSKITVVQIYFNEGDDIDVDVDVGSSFTAELSGWSDLESPGFFLPAVATADVTASATVPLAVTYVSTTTVNLSGSSANTDDLVADDNSSITLYADIKGTSPDARTFTLAKIKANVARKYSS